METVRTRPGGRSARVRAAVLEAVLSFLDEGRTQVPLPEVADRASVAPSSLYRRWGSWENVVTEALLEQSQVMVPVPDTGSVRSDLVEFAHGLAHFLSTPRGGGLVRAATAVERSSVADVARARFWDERFELGAGMVRRGVRRGELHPDTDARLLLEMVVAPLHLRQLLLGQDCTTTITEQVDLLLDGCRAAS